MSRDSSGTYTAPSNSVNPAVEGTAIDETDFNALVDDLESALTDSLDRTGKGKVTAHIDFDETTVSSPAANVGRLYGKDVGGVTSLFFKDSAGTDTNLLLASSGLAYTFSTTTTMADPGSGYIRFNHATLSSVTAIAIDDNDANAADLSAYVLTWDDVGTSNRGTLIIQNRTSPGSIAIFTISGASTDNSGWTELAVTYVTHAGSFGANAPLAVTYSRPGAAGSPGSAGVAGPNTGLDYAFNTATSGDPGSGKVLFNNATLASVSQINISETGRNAEALAALIATWDDSTNTSHYGHLRIFDVADRTKFLEVEITGTITDAGSYRTIPVTYTAGGTLPANDAVLAVMFERTGDKGSDGAGTGDVVGPAASIDSEIALYDSTTGKLIKRATTTGILKAASGVLSAASAGTDYVAPGGALGTPSSGTLTNCTGLPLAGVTDSTSVALGVGTLELGHASDTTLSRSAAGVLAVEGSIVKMVGVEEWFIPASNFGPRASNGCAALATFESTTNKVNFPYLAFDATTQEFAQCIVPRMPKSWNEGTITTVPQWMHPSTTTNFGVVWGVSAVAFTDDDAADTAFGTAQTSTDTGGTTSDIYHGPATSAITIGNSPAEGDTIVIQVSRNPSDGSDTMAVDAYFLGLLIRITTNAANDA